MGFRIGPAGWSYEDWKGRVYPDPRPPGFDELAFIASLFPTIEINSTFYRPASARMSESWAHRTPDGFVFTAKLWEKFTHGKEGFTPADVRLFQEGLVPLLRAGKLAALLMQFPWHFKDAPESRDRVRAVAEAFAEWAPLVVEVRHRSWLDALDFLGALKLSFCNIDQPRSSTAITGTTLVTGPVGYVRLHGRNAKAWFSKEAGRDQKYDYLYSPDELRDWSARIREMEGRADAIFVITNNHFLGKGVANALQLRALLGETPPPAPSPLVEAFPFLAQSPP
ncbi:MAG: DUF72 domain-containing protein [Planctomycetes bacterium]|nr:DUF72 domain-containing protein [Planctomycetota bacterium]